MQDVMNSSFPDVALEFLSCAEETPLLEKAQGILPDIQFIITGNSNGNSA